MPTILPHKHGEPSHHRRLDTVAEKRALKPVHAKDERAVGTIVSSSAPAFSAVGAQYGRDAASSDGLSSGVRSIDDWTIEDFMLLATVDGHIHARNRYNGMQLWELDVGKPMLETIYNTKNDSDPTDGWRSKPFIWIVEPKEDGALYILSPGPYPVLQSLGLTVKQLTDDLNPYSSDDPPVVYTAEKKSLMLVVDARTGRVTKSFSPSGSMTIDNPDSCHTQTPEYFNENRQNECKGFFNLGQTEYTVSIHDRNNGDHICTIKYSEWTSNNRDRDLQTQYRKTKDEMYLVSRYDGDVIAYDKKRSNFEKNYVFHQKLGRPVTRVFDVARKGDDNDPDPALVLLPQPPSLDISQDKLDNVWLNTTDAGSWYALSEANYPAVTDSAPRASCYTQNSYIGWEEAHILPERTGLVGVHVLNFRQKVPPTMPAIGAAPTVNDGRISVPAGIPQPPLETWTIDPPPQTIDDSVSEKLSVGKQSFTWTTMLSLPMVVSLLLLVLSYMRQDAPLKKWLLRFNKDRKAGIRIPAALEPTPPLAVEVETPASLPEAPTIVDVAQSVEEPVAEEVPAKVVSAEVEKPELTTPTPPEPEKKKVSFAGIPPEEEEEDSPLSRTTTIDEPSPAESVSSSQEIVAPVESAEQVQPTGAEDKPQEPAAPATPKKKKTHRGKRGGQKGRNRKPKDEEDIDQAVDAAKHLNEPIPMHPDEMSVINGDDVQDVSNIKRIGKLTIDFDRVLGNGSGGTFVFEGKWNVSTVLSAFQVCY